MKKQGFRKLLWLVIFWVIYIQLINISIYLYLGHFGTSAQIKAMLPEYDVKSEVLISFIMAVFGGLTFGSVEMFYLKAFSKRSFLWNIFFKGAIYLAFVLVLSIIGSLAYNSFRHSLPFWHNEVIMDMLSYMQSSGSLYTFLTIAVGILISLFLIQIDLKLGQNGLRYLVTGKYHQAKREERAFMFLDMKSSTVIAERIGHENYFELLNDFFADATPHIINHLGVIYQYIGDEISVSWPLDLHTDLSRCIQCFYRIEKEIEQRKEYYQKRYGFTPEFKAGIHAGSVTTGQIGIIKRELVHSGDVLNTASRIQGLCNDFGVKLIVSDSIKKRIADPSLWVFKAIEDFELRGKSERLNLYSVHHQHHP